MAPIRLIMVGGFLGAGKTTLIKAAARALSQRGLRVGIITNDQAPNLADTGLLKMAGFGVDEVSGGCFCCNFEELEKAWERVIERENPQVIIGEPVGSCTDISATVFQPIKKMYAERFDPAPFTVLADPRRLAEALGPAGESSLPENVLYIYQRQLEEADLIVINKVDLISPDDQMTLRAALAQRLPGTPVLTMSALRGDGVAHWRAQLERLGRGGGHLTSVDYQLYAEGEAALGWLNASAELRAGEASFDWGALAGELMEQLVAACREQGAEVAHLKLHLAAGAGAVQANLTSCREQPRVQVHGQPAGAQAHLIVNARCAMDPDLLREMVTSALAAAARDQVSYTITTLESFKPSPPKPTHHFSEVV